MDKHGYMGGNLYFGLKHAYSTILTEITAVMQLIEGIVICQHMKLVRRSHLHDSIFSIEMKIRLNLPEADAQNAFFAAYVLDENTEAKHEKVSLELKSMQR